MSLERLEKKNESGKFGTYIQHQGSSVGLPQEHKLKQFVQWKPLKVMQLKLWLCF